MKAQEKLLKEEEEAAVIEGQGLKNEATGLRDVMERYDYLEGEITIAKASMEKDKEVRTYVWMYGCMYIGTYIHVTRWKGLWTSST